MKSTPWQEKERRKRQRGKEDGREKREAKVSKIEQKTKQHKLDG